MPVATHMRVVVPVFVVVQVLVAAPMIVVALVLARFCIRLQKHNRKMQLVFCGIQKNTAKSLVVWQKAD